MTAGLDEVLAVYRHRERPRHGDRGRARGGLQRASRGLGRHYDERALAALIPMIATPNVFNRPDLATRQVAGAWG